MKKVYLLSLLLCYGLTDSSAQETGIAGFQPVYEFEDSPGNPLREYGKSFGNKGETEEITGDVYAEEDFVPGTLLVESKDKQLDILLRYNAVTDAVEVKLKGKDNVYVLPKLNTLIYRTPTYTYKYNSFNTDEGNDVGGFFAHYFDGAHMSFISKPVVEIRKGVQPTSGYGTYKPAHYSIKYNYYLLDKNGSLKEVRLREKDFRKEFSDDHEMKKYFSENKVKSVEDVVEMLKFHEELQKGS